MNSIYKGEIKHASIIAAASADLVAAVPGSELVVLSYKITPAQPTGISFQSGASSNLTGVMRKAAKQDIDAQASPYGHFKTVVGEKLNAVLTTATTIGGHICYQIVHNRN